MCCSAKTGLPVPGSMSALADLCQRLNQAVAANWSQSWRMRMMGTWTVHAGCVGSFSTCSAVSGWVVPGLAASLLRWTIAQPEGQAQKRNRLCSIALETLHQNSSHRLAQKHIPQSSWMLLESEAIPPRQPHVVAATQLRSEC